MKAFVHEITMPRVVFRIGAAADIVPESERLDGRRVVLIGAGHQRDLADRDDLQARARVLYGAFLSGLCLGNAVMGIHHKLCHVLGGRYDLPHSDMHSAVLPFAAEFNRGAAPEAMQRLGSALGAEAADAPVALWWLGRDVGAPTNLRDVGFDPAEIDTVAELVAHAQFANPAQVTTTAVAQLPRVRAPAARRARVENRHLASASRAALQAHDKGLGSRTASYGAAWQDNKSTHVTETVYWQVIVPTAPG